MKTEENSKKSKKWRVWARDIAIGVALVVGISAWQSKDMLSADGSETVSQRKLVSLDGQVKPLLSDEKPTLVYFFAPWYTICSLSIDNLSYLDQSKVSVVIIALDYSSNEEVQAFVDDHNITSDVFLGTNELQRLFQIQGYPSYYLVNEDAKIVSRSYGYSSAIGLKLREVFGT